MRTSHRLPRLRLAAFAASVLALATLSACVVAAPDGTQYGCVPVTETYPHYGKHPGNRKATWHTHTRQSWACNPLTTSTTSTTVAVARPTVTAVSPDQGSALGGDTVVVTGTGFTNATAVTVGSDPAASFTVDSDTQITLVTPPGPFGSDTFVVSTVFVTSPAGTASAGIAAQYRFIPPPG